MSDRERFWPSWDPVVSTDQTAALVRTVVELLLVRRGKRLLQKAEGYVATIKNGTVTFREGEWTGEAPGGLIRGPQQVAMLEATE